MICDDCGVMKVLKIAVCDDQKEYLNALVKKLDKQLSTRKVEYEINAFDRAKELLEKDVLLYDIFILDIQMPEMDGMTLAKEIRRIGSAAIVIFLTALIEPAREGYAVKAFDYILKSEFDEDFSETLQNALIELDARDDTILVQIWRSTRKLLIRNIMYIESDLRKVIIHTTDRNESPIETYMKLEELQSLLSGKGFFRCHKSYLVNLAFITYQEGMCFTLKNKKDIPISRANLKEASRIFLAYRSGV